MDVSLITSILFVAVAAGTSLVFATIGEIYTERSGILNLGVEGMMIVGAVMAFAAAYYSESYWIGIAAAALASGFLALIHAFLTITMRAEQVVTGLAITLAGTGLASFLGEKLGPGGGPLVGLTGPRIPRVAIPVLSDIPIIGEALFDQDVLVYIMYLLVIVSAFYLYKTRPGLYLRAVGENPQTADAMGVNVFGNRYLYTVIGGMLVGIGGAHLSLSRTPGWTENITGGRGWIAIALVIFAAWDPLRAVIGALLFGGISAIQFRLQAEGTTIPSSLLNMLPYILTVVVLVLVTWREGLSRRLGAPAALGIPYNREERT